MNICEVFSDSGANLFHWHSGSSVVTIVAASLEGHVFKSHFYHAATAGLLNKARNPQLYKNVSCSG